MNSRLEKVRKLKLDVSERPQRQLDVGCSGFCWQSLLLPVRFWL